MTAISISNFGFEFHERIAAFARILRRIVAGGRSAPTPQLGGRLSAGPSVGQGSQWSKGRAAVSLAATADRAGQEMRSLAAAQPATSSSASLVSVLVTPERLSAAAQWSKAAGVVEMAIGRAKSAADLQAAATRQLDLAQYGLSSVLDELAAVMAVPGRRERAKVVRFAPHSHGGSQRALAA